MLRWYGPVIFIGGLPRCRSPNQMPCLESHLTRLSRSALPPEHPGERACDLRLRQFTRECAVASKASSSSSAWQPWASPKPAGTLTTPRREGFRKDPGSSYNPGKQECAGRELRCPWRFVYLYIDIGLRSCVTGAPQMREKAVLFIRSQLIWKELVNNHWSANFFFDF